MPLAQNEEPSETQVSLSQNLQLIGDYMSVSCSMLLHCNSSCSKSKGHLVLHFIRNDYTRWISANEFLWNFKQKLFTTRQTVSEERDSEARSRNYCCRGKPITITYSCGKPITITYSWCVSVALVTQHAKHVCRIILLSATWPALLNFSTLSHKWHDFPEKSYWTRNVCFDFSFVWKVSHSKKNSERDFHKYT